MRMWPMSQKHTVEINTSHIYFPSSTIFVGVWEEGKKNGASIITKETLFDTLPPQMAECLMFLSRCVAFSLPSMGCVHSHCLMSKIEGKPCKLWMPRCQRHNTGKTVCRHVFYTLETSCSLARGLTDTICETNWQLRKQLLPIIQMIHSLFVNYKALQLNLNYIMFALLVGAPETHNAEPLYWICFHPSGCLSISPSIYPSVLRWLILNMWLVLYFRWVPFFYCLAFWF